MSLYGEQALEKGQQFFLIYFESEEPCAFCHDAGSVSYEQEEIYAS